MKGQASIELIIIAGLIIALSAAVAGKFLAVQDETMATAAARQGLISEIQKLDNKYILEKVEAAKCQDKIIINAFP